ncbi:MAG: ABC transporter substrate-binding protein [Clostridia bacterium]
MKKKLIVIISLILAFMLVAVACSKKTDVFEPGSTTSRKGGWLDQITMKIVGGDAAITQIQAGDIDIFAASLSRKEDLIAINNAGLDKSTQYGLFYEMTINPVGPVFEGTGKLNPFASKEVRQALNMLLDREYINQEVYGGGAFPKYVNFVSGLPDYARYVEVAREVEAMFAYDMDKAKEIITAEMLAMGATVSDGKFMHNGQQVEIIIVIRNDSDLTRIPIGDYVGSQLEAIGFKVDRQYKTASEASPIWIGSHPNEGLWHLYTGAWSVTGMSRDDGDNFQFFSSSASAYGFTGLWQSYYLDDETFALFDRLANNDFATVEERGELIREALMKDAEYSYRVWLIDGTSYSFWKPGVTTSYDLAAGVDSSAMTAFTIRYSEQEGGNLTWGTSDILVDPVNPVGGSNWVWDAQWKNFTHDYATLGNPFTGLPMKQRLDRAEIVIQTGLPVGKTYDWVDLTFEDTITVPGDAWADWDVTTQTFKTVSQVYPEGATARRKSTVYYPATLFDDVTWHDGSKLSVADFVMGFIMTFDVATEGSAIFEPSMAANLNAFKTAFKGMKIVSTAPLTIEFYSDTYYLDAEMNIASLWPSYGYGQAGWHLITAGNLASAAGELAYTKARSSEDEIEWMSYVSGPSLAFLSKHVNAAAASSLVPYAPTLGQYITAEEAAARYTNLAQFYAQRGHFLSGLGPYILDRVLPVEKTLTLVTNPNFVDYSDKWSELAEPKFSAVDITGKTSIKAGTAATFDISVTFKGAAYPSNEINTVKYLLYDATGKVIEVKEAAFVRDGRYKVELTKETTAALGTGACKLEIAVVAIPVSVPTFEVFEFVTE